MTNADDWNTRIIEEFRANAGQVGGDFAGAPLTLLHHVGRKSGKQSVTPVMYLPDERDPNTIYVFASKAGAPTHPAWYYNLTAAGTATIEIGTDTVEVTVEEVTGEERDRILRRAGPTLSGFRRIRAEDRGRPHHSRARPAPLVVTSRCRFRWSVTTETAPDAPMRDRGSGCDEPHRSPSPDTSKAS